MVNHRKLNMGLACGLCVLMSLNYAGAQQEGEEEPDPRHAMIMRKVLLILKDGDSLMACEFVNSLGDSTEVAPVYSNLLRDFYWKERDVPRMVMLGRAGIQFCLVQAGRCSKEDPAKAKKLKGAARSLAYNLATNTWPGWDDKGITLNSSDMAAGLDAARLSLRLATELGPSAEVLGNAHWVLGAQYVASGQNQEAIEAFAASAEKFRQAKKPDYVAMATGYGGIARMINKPTETEGKKQLQEAIATLEKLDNDAANSFIEQLNTAASVLVK